MSAVEVPFGGSNADTAVLLLAAAEDLDLSPRVVKTTEGGFLVPQEVYDKAFKAEKKPAKKSAAKKPAPNEKDD